LKHKFRKY